MWEASGVMLALPLPKELRSAAQYYRAIAAWKQGEAEAAREQLRRVIGAATTAYRAQGLLSIGARRAGMPLRACSGEPGASATGAKWASGR